MDVEVCVRPSPTAIGMLLVALALGFLAFLLFGVGRNGPEVGDAVETEGSRGGVSPAAAPQPLSPGGTSNAPDRASRLDPSVRDPSDPERAGERGDLWRFVGAVVDDETGVPLAGATVTLLRKDSPCPPTVDGLFFGTLYVRGPGARSAHVNARDDGTFEVAWGDPAAQLVARRSGYLAVSLCDVTADTPTTVRLRRGARIGGTAVRPDGRPVAGTLVVAKAPRGLPLTPGRLEQATTDAEGRFAVEGLVPEAFDLTFTHPTHFDETRPAVPAGTRDLKVVLQPAFAVTFVLKPDDGSEPDTPTAEWRVYGEARGGLEMLVRRGATASDDDPSPPSPPSPAADEPPLPTGSFRYAPIKVPAGRPSATFSVKAIGFLAWSSGAVELPPEGGAATLEVPLERDLTLGRARIAVEEASGRLVSFHDERCTVSLGRRDAKDVPAGVILRAAEAVEFPALPAGPYRFVVRSPKWAPATVELDVAAGLLSEARAVLRPTARVRVRFVATESMLVKFRLVVGGAGGEVAWPFVAKPAGPAGAGPEEADEPGDAQTSTAGPEGIVLTGLAPGRYVLEGLSPDVDLPPTAVDLREGETAEVEVAVARR